MRDELAGSTCPDTYIRSRYNLIFGEPGERYFFNTFTGSLQPVTEKIADLIARQGEIEGDPSAIDSLLKMGAIMPHRLDERQALLELRKTGTNAASINSLAFWLLTTEKCNYRCYYCYEDRDKSGDISYTAQEWLAFLDKFPALNDLHITWFGGEPLLNFPRLEELSVKTAEYCKQRGMFYRHSLITNAVLLTRPIADRLKELGLSRIQITLDGPKSYHERYKSGCGTFETVLDNLYYAATLFPVSVRINIDKNNAEAIPELLELLAERGFGNLSIYFASITFEGRQCTESHSGFTTEEFALVERQLQKKMCELGHSPTIRLSGARIQPCGAADSTFFTIGVDGSFAKCPHRVGQDIAGSLSDGILPSTFSHQWLKQSSQMPEKCLDCILLPSCMGGCPSRRYLPDSRGDSCETSRFNAVESLKLAISASKNLKTDLFKVCSTQEKLNQLNRSAKGTIVNRRQLRQAALQGGGLGMLLAAMGHE